MPNLWGIDLGGTKIEGAALSTDDLSKPIARLRVKTEAHLGYDHVLAQIASLVAQLERIAGPAPVRIGMGTPGVEDPSTGLVRNSNSVCLNGRTLSRDVSARLGRQVVMANDANCFALAEARLGAGRGASVVFGIILGTGVGGGVVVDGRVLGGLHGIAGEWGHNELEPDGLPCYCGKRGCVETVLAGPSLERFYELRTGTRRELTELVSRTDDPDARATLSRLYQAFGKAISVVTNILDPDVIVIGGGVGNIDGLYSEGPRELVRWIFNSEVRTRIVRPELGDSAGVFGAAMLTETNA